jgi:hypothetical protein
MGAHRGAVAVSQVMNRVIVCLPGMRHPGWM